MTITNPRILAFARTMRIEGLEIVEPLICDGRFHRARAKGDSPGTKHAWYLYYAKADYDFGVFFHTTREIRGVHSTLSQQAVLQDRELMSQFNLDLLETLMEAVASLAKERQQSFQALQFFWDSFPLVSESYQDIGGAWREPGSARFIDKDIVEAVYNEAGEISQFWIVSYGQD